MNDELETLTDNQDISAERARTLLLHACLQDLQDGISSIIMCTANPGSCTLSPEGSKELRTILYDMQKKIHTLQEQFAV